MEWIENYLKFYWIWDHLHHVDKKMFFRMTFSRKFTHNIRDISNVERNFQTFIKIMLQKIDIRFALNN